MAESDEELTQDGIDELNMKTPPLPEHVKHRCTDPFWVVFWLVSMAFEFYLHRQALMHGHARLLYNSYDWQQQFCGFNESVKDKPFLFWCKLSSEDGGLGGYNLDRPICVSECPGEEEVKQKKEMECYEHTFNTTVNRAVYATQSYLSFCMPENGGKGKVLEHVLGNSTLTAAIMFGGQVFHARWVFPISALVAMMTGYIYLFLLNKSAKLLVYACEVFLVVISFYWSYFFTLQQGLGIGRTYSISGTQASVFIFAGFGFFLLGTILVCWFCNQNSRLGSAVGCVEAASECLIAEPTLLIEPILAIVIKLVLLLWQVYTLVNIASTGQVIPRNQCGIDRSLHWSREQQGQLVFLVFMFGWNQEIVFSLSQYVITWVAVMWYFIPNDFRHRHKHMLNDNINIFGGYMNCFKYHFGTIALGSLLTWALRPLRWTIGPFARMLEGQNNSVTECLSCCLGLYSGFLGYVSGQAYMGVAKTSSSYWQAAVATADIINHEVREVKQLNGTQLIFQISGVGLITYLTMLLTYHGMVFFRMFADDDKYDQDPTTPMIAAACIGGLISTSIMAVFDSVGDTILFCFASEQRRRRALQGLRTPKEKVEGFLSWLWGDSETEDSDDPNVNYAPQKLSEVIREQKLRMPTG